jgi:hypothetical protein
MKQPVFPFVSPETENVLKILRKNYRIKIEEAGYPRTTKGVILHEAMV